MLMYAVMYMEILLIIVITSVPQSVNTTRPSHKNTSLKLKFYLTSIT